MKDKWFDELHSFFDTRSNEIKGKELSLEKLCYVSGRDPRLWNSQRYEDLIRSIKEQLELENCHSLLEVGCAVGFLAQGLARLVNAFTGVDVSRNAIKLIRCLHFKNATFRKANGVSLPFPGETFDRAICYDVFTNIPDLKFGESIVLEMLRVTKKGGKIMIGSLADKEFEQEYPKVVAAVSKKLDMEKGPLNPPEIRKNLLGSIRNFLPRLKTADPKIFCYFFSKQDFVDIGQRYQAETKIFDIHRLNPYYGYRFNVVYSKR